MLVGCRLVRLVLPLLSSPLLSSPLLSFDFPFFFFTLTSFFYGIQVVHRVVLDETVYTTARVLVKPTVMKRLENASVLLARLGPSASTVRNKYL